jgi:Haem-binding domain
MKKRLLLIPVGLLAAAQFVPLQRTNPPVTADFDGPPEVERILRASCYDCHSNETEWSWTAYVAPASWLVVRDVHRARDEYNLSEWGTMDAEDRAELPRKMVEEVEEGDMPLPMYLLVHPEARVSEADLATLRAWAGTTAEEERGGDGGEAEEADGDEGSGHGRRRGRGGDDH